MHINPVSKEKVKVAILDDGVKPEDLTPPEQWWHETGLSHLEMVELAAYDGAHFYIGPNFRDKIELRLSLAQKLRHLRMELKKKFLMTAG